MRALHLLKTAVGATWALRQAIVLRRHGIDIHVALPDGPMAPRFEAAGITVHRVALDLPVRAPWHVPATLARLRRLVSDVAPDIIHSHFVSTTIGMRLALGPRHRTPRLFQVPGPLHLEHAATRIAELATAGPADRWIGSCEWTCARYRAAGIEASRVFLSYYGVDLRETVPRKPGALRRQLGLPASTKIVGMVGFMYAPKRLLGQRTGLKGHEDLIDAIALMRRRGLDVVGVFIGGPWAGRTDYQARVEAYGRERCGPAAVFLGTRADVPELLADLDVVAAPSHSENVGGAAESLIAGRPTVATRVGGFPDLVVDGETGWLVPPRAPGALAEALTDALLSPETAAQRAARGQALARRLMDVDRTGAEIAAIYRGLLVER